MRSVHLRVALALGLVMTVGSGPAWAWGGAGHRIISQTALKSLPAELPAFLKTPEAVFMVGELGREPDRSRDAGQPHDADLDPGHFLDLDDQGATLGGDPVSAMPADREAYERSLLGHGASLSKAGYLYYTILDGYQQLAKDFAWWRLETAALKSMPPGDQKRFTQADLQLRQALILRDLGWWSHFVGDASQPMHLSIHYNGWGPFPNPDGFTSAKIHVPYEGPYVAAAVSEAAVAAALPALRVCPDPVRTCLAHYLAETHDQVVPLYRLWGASGFKPGDPAPQAFTTARIAAGAAALRDLIVKAWRDSEEGAVGYPPIRVRDAEAGAPVPFAVIHGDD